MVSDGVRTVLATLRISLSRGTPSVTFFADTPAKWNVLSVICVAGSPMDWAASTPHISPAWARAWTKRLSISPMSQSKAARFSRYSKQHLRAASVHRMRIAKRAVGSSASVSVRPAFTRASTAATPSASSSVSMADAAAAGPDSDARHVRSARQSRATPLRATRGSSWARSRRGPHSNWRWAAQTRRARFTGRFANGSASLSGSRHAKMARSASRSRWSCSSSFSSNAARATSWRQASATSSASATPPVTESPSSSQSRFTP
mmetsp:Transcript_10660/g.33980  ORF Transcript_10660/g.33980 Transcript_10660/m.33980 type:complete len:262 (-) Transcript_10660:2877-3662(-)